MSRMIRYTCQNHLIAGYYYFWIYSPLSNIFFRKSRAIIFLELIIAYSLRHLINERKEKKEKPIEHPRTVNSKFAENLEDYFDDGDSVAEERTCANRVRASMQLGNNCVGGQPRGPLDNWFPLTSLSRLPLKRHPRAANWHSVYPLAYLSLFPPDSSFFCYARPTD